MSYNENIQTSSMDKPIAPKEQKKKKYIQFSLIGLVVLIGLLYLIFRDNASKLKIDNDKITIEEIKKDVFQDFVSVIGTVEPIQTVYLDATEGGRVEEIYIREGTKVAKGDPIIKLSNDNLLLEISNYEAEVARAINDLKSMRFNLENQQITNSSQLVELQYDLFKLKRDYERNAKLLSDKYISNEEFIISKENYERKKQLFMLLSKKLYTDSVSFKSRIESSEESVESMQRNLELIRKRLNKLIITAPVSGELASLNPELGKVIGYGTAIGTINILDSYKLRAEIDEHYIDRIKLSLQAQADFSEKNYATSISKIYPEVKNGQFSIDLTFNGKIPDDMRIGQTTRIHLELGQPQMAILVPRGGFYQSTGGEWIFVVDKNGKQATKRLIKVGRQNPNYYEIIEGLEPGEKVITSSYDIFGDVEKLILKK